MMTIHGHTVRIDGRTVATLSYSGRVVAVYLPIPEAPVVGRLVRQATSPAAPYDAWTALHPSVQTPSDRLLARDVSMDEAVQAVLDQARAAA